MRRCTARRINTSNSGRRHNDTRIRYNRHRRRTCRLRSGLCRRTPGVAHAVAHHGHGQDGFHVVQPGRRRCSQRTDSQRNRCFGRTDGTHYRPHRDPVSDAQPFEGRSHVEPPCAMRQNPFLGGVAPYARKHAQPLYLAGRRHRAAVRHLGNQTARDRRTDAHGHRIRLQGRHTYRRYVPRRADALRHIARRGRQGRGRRFARDHGVPARNRIRNRAYENRYARTPRCPHDRLRNTRTAIRGRKTIQIFLFP